MDDVRIKLSCANFVMKEGPAKEIMEEQWRVIIKTSNRMKTQVKWVMPPEGTVKINTDGSLKNNRGSWGAAMRDHEGQAVKIAHGISPYNSIDEIEMDAAYQGLELAWKHGFRDVFINVDSSTILHYLKMQEPPWIVRQRVKKMKELMEKMNTCIVEHCHREVNMHADELASLRVDEREVELDVNDLSNKCNGIILDDRSGKMYGRE